MMKTFVYDDDEPREYNDFGLVERGRTVEASEAPDFRWKEEFGAVPGIEQEGALL